MPRPLSVDLLTFLTLNVVSESRVTWATSVPIFCLPEGLSVCSRLRPDVCHRRQTSDAHHRLIPPTLGSGHNNV